MEIIEVLEELKSRARRDVLDAKLQKRALASLDGALEAWRRSDEVNLSSPAHLSLLEKAKVLKAKKPLPWEELDSLGRYGRAAWFDAAGKLAPYRWFVRCYFGATIAFLALTPQYLPAILAIVFIVPIYLGLRGLKKRTRDGRNLAMSVFPMSLLASTMAIRGYVAALGDWGAYAEKMAGFYNVSPALAGGISIAFFVLALVGSVSAIAGTWFGFRHGELFA